MFTQPVNVQPWKPKAPAVEEDTEHPDGTWDCSRCQNHNFAGRRNCNSCRKPKFPDNNWECTSCGNYNFMNRKVCNSCKKPKADDEIATKIDQL